MIITCKVDNNNTVKYFNQVFVLIVDPKNTCKFKKVKKEHQRGIVHEVSVAYCYMA